MIKQASIKTVISLSMVAGICAFLIAGVKIITAKPIAINQRQQSQAIMREMVGAMEFQQLSLPKEVGYTAYLEEAGNYFLSKNKQIIILPWVVPNAYHGKIHFLLAINKAGMIKNVRVLSHQETPALGDKIELSKSTWILAFNGQYKTQQKDFQVKKYGGQFDQFSGATITPQAFTTSLFMALKYIQENHAFLFDTAIRIKKANKINQNK